MKHLQHFSIKTLLINVPYWQWRSTTPKELSTSLSEFPCNLPLLERLVSPSLDHISKPSLQSLTRETCCRRLMAVASEWACPDSVNI